MIYNRDGTIADIQAIKGNSAPENLVESGSKLFTEVPTNSFKYNWTDPRGSAKKAEISLNLKAGQRADFSTSSPKVLVHNLILAGLELGGFVSGLSNAETTGLITGFVKELSSDGKLIFFANALSESRSSDEVLRSQAFADLMKEFKQYLAEGSTSAAISTAQSTANDRLSDAVDEVVGKLGPLGALTARTSKIVFGAIKVSNFTLRASQAIKQFSSHQVPYSLGLDIPNTEEGKKQPPTITSSSNTASKKLNQAMQDYSSCITQYSASHIGSASCFIARSSAQESVYEQQRNTSNVTARSLQERSQYTDWSNRSRPIRYWTDLESKHSA